ncbi:mycothiol transferase [Arthrobacter sp. AOP36-A1-22]|uniref:mycothiol transferase n=1 Tax=Arthrobacter sp. AOP36-A1-22 TaxID=3457684 RepID=UPI0040339AC9
MSANIARELLRDGFDRVAETVRSVTSGTDASVLLHQPDPQSNHAAWLIWHLTRVQDDHLADLAAVLGGAEAPSRGTAHQTPAGQLWLEHGWAHRLALPYKEEDTGFGHDGQQVRDFDNGDSGLLSAYHQAVHDRTVQVLESLRLEDFERVVDQGWDPPVTAASRLVSVLNDTTQHAGQAAYVRGLAERALG